ncbi:MAG: methionyl-tRNA formyltransferase [Defluviitaleaceae bacterium]|nr:methionyl-tRNA formyltransferase [Defluviitaleaceae bacterium]
MKILFMGTPDFAVPILDTLSKKHQIVAVATQPDRPKGRGKGMAFSPVKEYALSLSLPVLQPEKVKDDAFVEKITALGADIFVVVAYGQILPSYILQIPPLGCINIHASLLPKYRGAAPMQRAILNGDKVTGITIMYMDKGMDTGDMILKKNLDIEDSDRFANIHDKMSTLSCECIIEALDQIAAGTAVRVPQNNEEATYAPMLTKEDGLINWKKSTSQIINQVRALDPWPGTYTYYDGQMLKVWDCAFYEKIASDAQPGEVIENGSHLAVKTGDGILSITMVQGQGGKRMSTADYLRGRAIDVGKVLG